MKDIMEVAIILFQAALVDLEDASNEIILLDDEEDVPYLFQHDMMYSVLQYIVHIREIGINSLRMSWLICQQNVYLLMVYR